MAEPIPLQSLGPTPADTPHHSLSLAPSRRSSLPFATASSSTAADEDQEPQNEGQQPDPESPNYISVLAPVDGGKTAWLFLIAATTIEALVWGLPFSIGILHEYWTNTLFEGRGESSITLAATLQTGLMYMSAAVFGPLMTAFPAWSRVMQITGLVAASVSMITSAFVTEPWHLIVTIGCFYPLAGALYMPCATLLFEWFFARRGLATGIMYAGTGAGGAIFPFVVSGFLSKVGYKATMISLGIGFAIIGGLNLVFIKRRIPISSRQDQQQSDRRRSQFNWGFLKSRLFFAGAATILMTSLGNFVPSLWLPSFAKELNLTRPNGTALIAIMNAASVPGNAVMGYMSDRLPFVTVIAISCVGTALSCLFLWGFGQTDAMLVSFVLVFGLLGLSFSALWSKMISLIAPDDALMIPLIFSIFASMRGIGNITSGPISDALLKIDILKGSVGAYGYHNYGILLVYTGTTILTGGATGLLFKTKSQSR